jgi:hypothetical protein
MYHESAGGWDEEDYSDSGESNRAAEEGEEDSADTEEFNSAGRRRDLGDFLTLCG